MTTHIISASWGRLLDGVSNGGHAGWEAGGPGTARLPFTLVGDGPLTTTEPAIMPGCGGAAAAGPAPASVRTLNHHRTVTGRSRKAAITRAG
ncbi:hypothetical protein [Azospirillum argentinense]